MIREWLARYCKGLKQALDAVPVEAFEELVRLLEEAYENERQVFLMGNGGSGATASHAACDLNKSVSYGLEKRFRVLCLNDNIPTTLAYANDVSYEDVFVEPLKNFLRSGDVVVGISGSGNSRNVLKAVHYAKQQGAHTVGLTGFDGGQLARLVHTSVVISVNDMQMVEDVHLSVFHVVIQILYARLRQPDFESCTVGKKVLT